MNKSEIINTILTKNSISSNLELKLIENLVDKIMKKFRFISYSLQYLGKIKFYTHLINSDIDINIGDNQFILHNILFNLGCNQNLNKSIIATIVYSLGNNIFLHAEKISMLKQSAKIKMLRYCNRNPMEDIILQIAEKQIIRFIDVNNEKVLFHINHPISKDTIYKTYSLESLQKEIDLNGYDYIIINLICYTYTEFYVRVRLDRKGKFIYDLNTNTIRFEK